MLLLLQSFWGRTIKTRSHQVVIDQPDANRYLLVLHSNEGGVFYISNMIITVVICIFVSSLQSDNRMIIIEHIFYITFSRFTVLPVLAPETRLRGSSRRSSRWSYGARDGNHSP